MPAEPTPAMSVADGAEEAIPFRFDGRDLVGRPGDTLASALWRAGVRVLRHSPGLDERRGLFCGVGHCYECRVVLHGVSGVRACLLPLRAHLEAWREPALNGGGGE